MMTKTLRDLLAHAETWPREDQDELADYAREIEARRTGVYRMSDDERAAVSLGMAEADQGKFVSDDLVAKADKRHDVQVTSPRRGAGCNHVDLDSLSARAADA